jgi:hypothetical protein
MCQQMNETHSHEPNIWAQRLISLLLILLGISFAGILILGSYYDQPITKALSADIQDNERFDSGLGIHSFGDFQELRYALPTADYPNIWINSNFAYTPSALLPNIIAKRIQEIFGIEVSLFSYLTALVICTAAPAIYASRRLSTHNYRVFALLTLTVCAQPFIMTFDRGNSIGFVLPFLVAFATGYFYNSKWSAVIGLVGAFAFRPQFALLGVALVFAKQLRKTVAGLLFGALVFFGSFLFMPGSYSNSFNSWLENLKLFTRKYDHVGPFPVNLSMKTAFGGVLNGSSFVWVSGLLLIIISSTFILFETANSRGRALILVLGLPCLLPALSFGYYSVFVLVIAAMIFTEPRFLEPPLISCSEENSRRQIKTRVAYNYLVITVVAISLAPIPFVREVGRNSIALESFSTLWTIVLIATLAQQIVEHYNEKVAE